MGEGDPSGTGPWRHGVVGLSRPMRRLRDLIGRAAASGAPVLIRGETGTGKELAARAVHLGSARARGPFLAVNCAALSDDLLASELFGHERGSFTGADRRREGLLEAAAGGTLFLDEVGEASPRLQAGLLRALRGGSFLPVGGRSARRTDARVVAATNGDLRELADRGLFREDLLYRIDVVRIDVPPLREREGDVPLLAGRLLAARCRDLGLPPKTLSPACLARLAAHPWPGNVRELENEVERILVEARGARTVLPEHLSPGIGGGGGAGAGGADRGALRAALEGLEARLIREGLARCRSNRSRLARELGVSRASLLAKIDKHGLGRKRGKPVAPGGSRM